MVPVTSETVVDTCLICEVRAAPSAQRKSFEGAANILTFSFALWNADVGRAEVVVVLPTDVWTDLAPAGTLTVEAKAGLTVVELRTLPS